jgi:hypothetical protein
VVRALLAGGARVLVPARSEAEAERFHLAADPATVPRLRTAMGSFADPAMPDRVAAVARREFGGVDHLVSVLLPPALGPLVALDPNAAQQAIEGGLTAPAGFLLGMLRHLDGAAPLHRVIVVTPAPGTAGEPDTESLGRVFLEGLVDLLREARRPGLEFHVLRAAGPGTAAGAESLGRAVGRLLGGGAPPTGAGPGDAAPVPPGAADDAY